MKRIGLQMYTVRELLRDNYESTLTKIKEIGYDSIQLAGNTAMMQNTAETAKKLDMHVIGIMANIDLCETEGDKLFSICRTCGASDIGIGSAAVTYSEAMEFAERADRFAKRANKEGITVSYHNHSSEFMRTENGKTVIEIFIENMKNVYFMPDTYWIQYGGGDIRHFIEKVKDRVKILHLKDMKKTSDGHMFAPVGSGNLYIEGIINTALTCGIENFFIEQDICEENPLVCAEKSYNYVKELILK